MPRCDEPVLPFIHMVRRRWPDVIIVVAILALTGAGVWAIWGEELWGDDAPEDAVRVEGGRGA